MWPESGESPQPLRTGLTTGSCATACCVAASEYLLAQKKPSRVSITLPKGKIVELDIDGFESTLDSYSSPIVRTSTIKDAGDDPDVTHQATVFVELKLIDKAGVFFKAGRGVGTVTRTGLALSVGEPAINETPRRMMSQHLIHQAGKFHYAGGFEVTVGVENGEALALKTMNPRLGILGGLSILGTSGIVRPYSCAAWIASIHQGIDVAASNGVDHIAATTGNTSESAIKSHYQMDEMALIEMGDFAGAVIKHLKKVPVPKLTICGGFGKLTKLANGHMDLNSRASSIDFQQLSDLVDSIGGEERLCQQIETANTSMEVLEWCQSSGIDLASQICQKAQSEARNRLPEEVDVEIYATNRKGDFIGHAGFAGNRA